MNHDIAYDRCKAFIDCHLKESGQAIRLGAKFGERPFVTISGQAGAGGLVLASRLVNHLQQRLPGPSSPWTFFEKNLVQKVLEEHHLPKNLARFMPENRVSAIADMMESLFGIHPPDWSLVHHTAETILHLAELGYVILVDRAANIITDRFPAGVHVRVVGSREIRVHRIMEYLKLDPKAAQRFVDQTDRGRRRYVKDHFEQDIEDPLLYHVMVNTDFVPLDEATRLVGDLVVEKRARMEKAP